MKKQWLYFLVFAAMVIYFFRRWFIAKILHISSPDYQVHIDRGLRIVMPDGVVLVADHYRPKAVEKFPTIMMRSPYGRRAKDSGFGLLLEFCGQRFAEHGYNVLIQDVRGRFDSSGVFEPFLNEHDDGLATISWIEQQSWFNGAIGLWGGSYLGLVQWVVASTSPSVKALVPSITGSNLHKILYPDGSLDLGLVMRWLKIFQLLDNYRNYPLPMSLFLLHQMEREIIAGFDHLPIDDADRVIIGHAVPFYKLWMENADPNTPLWQESKDIINIRNVSAPVHLIGGWYDFFLRTLLEDYQALKESGHEPYLTIGPWHHFGAIMSFIELKEGLIWFDAKLKGRYNTLRKKPVKIFVMGSNRWIELDTWPPQTKKRHYYLQSGQMLGLSQPHTSVVSTYHYDPSNPTPALGGTQFGYLGGAYDNRVLEARSDVLTFTTSPLEEGFDVVGAVRLILYVKSSANCTDFFGRLCDVKPDGQSINVCDGLTRVKFEKEVQQKDGSLRIEIDLWSTAYHFPEGHCIRLQVSSGSHPRWSRNLGLSGFEGGQITMISAEQTIYHDIEHPSTLILPLIS